ncbi:MAG: hypothetical protein DWQ37_19530 [Planctomycetota bacterium]|nr:MAG: hypothetical protein DWQ37_19530 [Planctomycetota bacterium]
MRAHSPEPEELSPSTGSPATGPVGLVRLLSGRYLWALLAVASLAVVDEAIIQPQLVRLNLYAPAINVAGRQRMLSQKIAKNALALATRSGDGARADRREQLLKAVYEWNTAHRGLLSGSVALGLEPIADERTAAALLALEPRLEAIRTAAHTIADTSPDDTDHDAAIQAALDTILSEEPQYLEGMERVVGMLEVSAGRQVDFLRWCGMAAMLAALGLLVAVYFVVLRPALNLIRQQITKLADSESRHREMAELLTEARDELESRVAERTSELVAANRALEGEIAERQAAESRMRELSGELAHASRITALGQLATGLAHEINQPLASITNYADVLELSAENGTFDAETTASTIARLKRAALRAGQIVRSMRNFVRAGGGQRSVVELNALVREVCDLCRPQLEQAQVQWSVDLAVGEIIVEADPLEIQQVVVNLVQNAAQAVAACDREDRHVDIRTCVEGHNATVEVADTGPGFGTAGAEESFAPFFSTKPEGLGMGLSISRTILERHDGRLWGRNRAGGGAVVGFQLPLATEHEQHVSTSNDCICR